MFLVIVDTIIASCEGFYLLPDGVPEEDAEPLKNEKGDEIIDTYAKFAAELRGEPLPRSGRPSSTSSATTTSP
jgi:hypothetical protein